MMETLIGLALKSVLIAGVTLGLLHLTRRRSAADRSWIAHLGLFALVAMPLASLALPALSVELPAAIGVEASAPVPAAIPADLVDPPFVGTAPAIIDPARTFDWTPYAYAIPALALLLVTLVALLRLFGLRGRAQVLVDPVWLSALAHAQRRMGFKNGTALLTSSELSSPISWGLMRPVILLNDEALAASGEAEAIIAHELAHVARLDWAKLMLARVATAIFWFNPFAWVLAREAHQLREEAADDAVLGANIADTDYAQLLVGVARHECRGLLLGAHGISPGKGSLTRRVRRVLDSSLARASGGRSWVAGFAAGMLVMAAPLAALTFAPKAELPEDTLIGKQFAERGSAAKLPGEHPTVSDVIAQAVSSAVTGAVTGAVATTSASVHPDDDVDIKVDTDTDTDTAIDFGVDPDNDLKLDEKVVEREVRRNRDPIEEAIAIKIHGLTPEYAAAIAAAAPQLGKLDSGTLVGFKIHGVTPAFIRELGTLGYRRLDAEAIAAAAIHRVSADYARQMAGAGYPGLSLEKLTEMRIHNVTPAFVAKFRRAGYSGLSADQIIKMKIHGVDPDDVNREAISSP